MRNFVTGTLSAALLSASVTSAAADGCSGVGTTDHTIYIYIFGFVPETTYVCPGDRVRIHNKAYYRMRTTIPSLVSNGNGGYWDFYTGNLNSGQISDWATVATNSDVSFNPSLSDYGYGSYAIYPGTIVIGQAPTKYAEGERYEDPSDD